jgi:hypothetical protein
MAPDPDPMQQVPPWWTDPTKNVESLVEAAMRRQDDLREMQSRYTAIIGGMRETHATYVTELRSGYETKLRDAESGRIDAIRAVDVGAVNRAAEVSATQATTLATQVATSAEALRGQVEAARQQTATALAAALEPIQKDIQDLRRAQYEAQGKQGQVVETRDVRSASRLDYNLIITVVIAIVGILTFAVLYATKK